jgi:hypothetical protein
LTSLCPAFSTVISKQFFASNGGYIVCVEATGLHEEYNTQVGSVVSD